MGCMSSCEIYPFSLCTGVHFSFRELYRLVSVMLIVTIASANVSASATARFSPRTSFHLPFIFESEVRAAKEVVLYSTLSKLSLFFGLWLGKTKTTQVYHPPEETVPCLSVVVIFRGISR